MDWPQNEFRQELGDLLSYDKCENEVYLPAYAMGLQPLASGVQMDAAVLTGWRVFALQPNGGALLAEMSLASGGQPSQLGTVSQGDRAKAAFAALSSVRAMPDLKNWDLGWLSVPGVLFEGFWLKPNTPNVPDLMVPVFTLDQEMQRANLLTTDFMAIIKPFAQKRLAYDDCPEYDKQI